ncbi:MAG: hypothetical protein ACKVOH_04015, partial [Chlamydiales bacterium]
MRCSLLLLYLFCTTLTASPSDLVNRLVYGGWAQYQPIVINGEVVYSPHRVNHTLSAHTVRHDAIRGILQKYNHPIKVLEIGANSGFYSLSIAKEFGATVVMNDSSDRLADICTLN